ncbi:hypothetical protein [Argonema antarcticum]|uniref:hypothetical protein n=1 Tax=Argonema antarcticum TaxID=2942763 RepID=UPI0020110A3A|nr:hypothetical protein [Argonema antarcticum]MCL1469929.1 hypothetical protein [Argonema antarcticum A004/B2]
MNFFSDKLIHFVVGLAVGAGYWWLLERYAKEGVKRINPIWFLVMLIWGASGLFFFRKLHIPVLSDQFFYMAVPDWDIPLYNWTRFRFLIHRSWLFHSTLFPLGLLILSWWSMKRDRSYSDSSHQWWWWLRDAAIGLAVGMSAHLIWDALLSSTKHGFTIFGWSYSDSLIWLVLNLILGLGIPFLIILSMGNSFTEK